MNIFLVYIPANGIQVFRNENSSQTSAYLHFNYSYSGLFPIEHALNVNSRSSESAVSSQPLTIKAVWIIFILINCNFIYIYMLLMNKVRTPLKRLQHQIISLSSILYKILVKK